MLRPASAKPTRPVQVQALSLMTQTINHIDDESVVACIDSQPDFADNSDSAQVSIVRPAKTPLHAPGLAPAKAAAKVSAQAPAGMPVLQTAAKAADVEQKAMPQQDGARVNAEVMQDLPSAEKVRDAVCSCCLVGQVDWSCCRCCLQYANRMVSCLHYRRLVPMQHIHLIALFHD